MGNNPMALFPNGRGWPNVWSGMSYVHLRLVPKVGSETDLARSDSVLSGQFGHFLKFAKEKCNHPYPLERYAAEAKRLLTVLEKRLERREFLVSEGYSIADIATCPWVDAMEKLYFGAEKLQLDKFENVVAWRNRCLARPASLKGIEVCPLSRSKPAS